ncbi:unnamed protein product, partial [Prorocentrum cordatum]
LFWPPHAIGNGTAPAEEPAVLHFLEDVFGVRLHKARREIPTTLVGSVVLPAVAALATVALVLRRAAPSKYAELQGRLQAASRGAALQPLRRGCAALGRRLNLTADRLPILCVSYDLFLGLGYNQLAEDFQSATSALGVSLLKATLYSLRHGGASHDRSTGARGLGGVQQRGGWKAFKSVLRYEKHGRLSLELRKLSDQQREALRAAGGDYVGVFNRSLVAPHIRQERASKSSRDVGR